MCLTLKVPSQQMNLCWHLENHHSLRLSTRSNSKDFHTQIPTTHSHEKIIHSYFTLIYFVTTCVMFSILLTYKHFNNYHIRQMLKGPALKSLGLYISVFQDRPDRGALNIIKKKLKKIIFKHILCIQYYKVWLF